MTVFKVESEEMLKRQTPVCQHQDRLQSEAPDHFIQSVHKMVIFLIENMCFASPLHRKLHC